MSIMKEAAAHRLSRPDSSLLQYGLGQGDRHFRYALARFLSSGYKTPVEAEALFITNGNSQGLDWICHCFTQPGDTVFVEEPTYHLVMRIFHDRGLNIVAIPTDDQGLVIEALEEKLAIHNPVLLYTIPVFHNPSTVTLSPNRRRRLVALSRQHNFLILADEVYQLLSYTTTPPPPMLHYNTEGTVLSLGSFSKILGPGLRLGWIQTKPDFIERLKNTGVMLSGGGLNPFTSGVVHSVLELGLQDRYLTQLKSIYQQRMETLCTALRRYLPPAVTFLIPQGGFFVWVHLPKEINTEQLLPEALQHNVGFQPGVKFSCNQTLQNYLRLSFAHYETEELTAGAKRLGQVIDLHMSQKSSSTL